MDRSARRKVLLILLTDHKISVGPLKQEITFQNICCSESEAIAEALLEQEAQQMHNFIISNIFLRTKLSVAYRKIILMHNVRGTQLVQAYRPLKPILS